VIFISYSWEDAAFTRSFVAWLSQQGYKTWVDYQDLKLEKSLVWQIALAIWSADIFFLIDSANSQSSQWVKFEVLLANVLSKKVLIINV
jgi:hypothetical protein